MLICVGWGERGEEEAWFSGYHYLFSPIFPIDEAACKQMQNSVILTLFPNINNHVGRNLSFKTSTVAKLIIVTRNIREGGNCRLISSKGL